MEKEITAKLKFKTPQLPNFIKVCVGYETLDEAIANNGLATVSVGSLDDKSIDAVIEQWAGDFREHCKQKSSNA